MKVLLIFIFLASQIFAQAPADTKSDQSWIAFYKTLIDYQESYRQLNKGKTEETNKKFTDLAADIDEALDAMVANGELIKEVVSFNPKKWTKDQQQLMTYLELGLKQRYGAGACHEMLGAGLLMRATVKELPELLTFTTRLPKQDNIAIKQILAGKELENLNFTKPQTLKELKGSKQIWIQFYSDLSIASSLHIQLNTSKDADPLKIRTALHGLEFTLEKLTDLGVLKKKTYPFSISQLSEDQAKEYLALVSSFDKKRYGSVALKEMAGIGSTQQIKSSLAEAIKAKAISFPSLKNETLTIYLPQSQFDQATKLLDSVNVKP